MNFDVVDVAHGGEDAIIAVEKHHPDLVLMDIMLADSVTGVEAMKKIREHSDVPVIYISAQTDAETKSQAIGISNSFYLMKPVNMNELKSALGYVHFAA